MDIGVLSKQKKFYPAKEIPFLSFLYVNKAEARRERERKREESDFCLGLGICHSSLPLTRAALPLTAASVLWYA